MSIKNCDIAVEIGEKEIYKNLIYMLERDLTTPNPSEGGEFECAKAKQLHKQKSLKGFRVINQKQIIYTSEMPVSEMSISQICTFNSAIFL